MVNVGGGDASNGDTAVLGQVDGVLLGQLLDLIGLETGKGEHANLVGDVRPVLLGAELLELSAEELAHGDDAVGHLLDLTLPLVVQRRVVEDLGGEAGAVDGGVGVHRADEDLELGIDALDLLGVLADDGEDTDTLTVETLGNTQVSNQLPRTIHSVVNQVMEEVKKSANIPCSWRTTGRAESCDHP